MIDWLSGLSGSMPPWLLSKMMTIIGLIIIFISLNYAAMSNRNKSKK